MVAFFDPLQFHLEPADRLEFRGPLYFSRADSRLIASSGRETSISFLRGGAVILAVPGLSVIHASLVEIVAKDF
jgi:hypothetical protein